MTWAKNIACTCKLSLCWYRCHLGLQSCPQGTDVCTVNYYLSDSFREYFWNPLASLKVEIHVPCTFFQVWEKIGKTTQTVGDVNILSEHKMGLYLHCTAKYCHVDGAVTKYMYINTWFSGISLQTVDFNNTWPHPVYKLQKL